MRKLEVGFKTFDLRWLPSPLITPSGPPSESLTGVSGLGDPPRAPPGPARDRRARAGFHPTPKGSRRPK